LFPPLGYGLLFLLCHYEGVPPFVEEFSTSYSKPFLSSSCLNARRLLLLVRRFVT
jgi:hypothetical protein